MSDIDFLGDKKPADDQEPKNKDDKEEKIIWSEPEEDKPLAKEVPFSLLSFLNKKKETEKPAAESRPTIDKNKIRELRREILKLIKRNESLGPEEKKKTGKNLLAGLIEKFKKQPSHKEILIDYQQVFNQEKIKRSLPAGQADPAVAQLSALKFDSPARLAEASAKPATGSSSARAKGSEKVSPKLSHRDQAGLTKQVFNVRPSIEKKPAAARPAPEFKNSFLSGFLKIIKDKIAAFSRSKLRPAKNNLAEISQKIQPEIVKTPPAKPAPEEKREVSKTKEEPAEVLETNLIKGEIITFFDWRKKIVILISAILIPSFFITAVYFGLTYYQKQNQTEIQDQAKKFSELTAVIKQEEVGLKEITDFQARLKIISQIFAKHIYWTNFFKFLEDNTVRDIYYAGFSGDTGGDYSLDAIGSRFSNISEQVDILRNNEKITDVQAVGGEFIPGDAANKTRVKFTLSFSILKSIFTE